MRISAKHILMVAATVKGRHGRFGHGGPGLDGGDVADGIRQRRPDDLAVDVLRG